MPREIKLCNNCKSLNIKYIKNGYLECLDCGNKLDVFIATSIIVYIQEELDKAVEAEREACALVLEAPDAYEMTLKQLAEAIRARGKK